ncbi:MAG: YgiQ family radical SAM protein [Marinilabiliaceae bacterium]|nr:YgiQ family radical SAM protein [Marinilabiliaceae bacterium]
MSQNNWLPTSAKEINNLGWDNPDVIIFSGDAYIDHPAFGTAIIARVLESIGVKVAIIPQPNWQDDLRDFKKLGTPNLFFGVTSGNMDSMVNHYTANRRLRSDDAFTPGGKAGFRPDYATAVYSRILKKLFPETPVVLGGIEASLRRFTHYDYWKDILLPSILHWSDADLIVYGSGEKPVKDIVKLLLKGVPFSQLKNIPQTVYMIDKSLPIPNLKNRNTIELTSHEICLKDKLKFAENFKIIEEESNRFEPSRLHQVSGNKRIIVNPPYQPMTTAELDAVYDLPFTRLPHPRYRSKGSIPAFEMIKNSVTIHRGCFGGCAFCTISAHQGKFISSRSKSSILKEVKMIAQTDGFKGYISDLGGPSANMYGMKGKDFELCKNCCRPSCIFPKICKNLDTSHQALSEIYRETDKVEGIKKTSIGSGIRYDLLMNNDVSENEKKVQHTYIKELIIRHISGRFKVAPEHVSEHVLKIMRKPSFKLFKEFKVIFEKINQENNLSQQLIPYFISSHPGTTEKDMVDLSKEMKKLKLTLEQVQDFTPTPMTLSTAIFYSGVHPYTMQPIYTARNKEDKLRQKKYFF